MKKSGPQYPGLPYLFKEENHAKFFANVYKKIFMVKVVPLNIPDHHPNFSTDLLNHPVEVVAYVLKLWSE